MTTIIKIDEKNKMNWQNVTNSGDLKWSGGSWKNYWIKYSEQMWPQHCCREECSNEATDGAHVVCVNSDIKYIVPLCGDHNPRSKEKQKLNPRFSIKIGTVLVNADDRLLDNIARGKECTNQILDVIENQKYI